MTYSRQHRRQIEDLLTDHLKEQTETVNDFLLADVDSAVFVASEIQKKKKQAFSKCFSGRVVFNRFFSRK